MKLGKAQIALFGVLSIILFLGALKTEFIKQDRPLAIVKRFKPNVDIENSLADRSKRLDLESDRGEQLFDGDTLRTDAEGYALVVFMDKSIAKVKPQSLLIVRGETERTSKRSNTRIDLSLGEIFLNVEPQGNNDFEVSTSRSLASVKGTEFGGNSDGYVWVKEGQVDVTALQSGETISLFEKMYAQVNGNADEIESGTLSDNELTNLDDGFDELNEELIKKQIKLRFKDANGQIREVTIDYYEKGN
ncbi:MAG: FecR domain-containing protein [Balneola sp.]